MHAVLFGRLAFLSFVLLAAAPTTRSAQGAATESQTDASADGRTAWVVVTDELYQLTGTTSEDTDNFVNYVRSVKGVEVAVLFRQTGSAQYKISMRSKGRVDLSVLAQSLGGGGHENAAGGVLDGTLEEVTRLVIGKVEKAIAAQIGSRETISDGRRS